VTGAEPHLGDLVSALLDGELPVPLEDASHQHLAACPACAEELALVAAARSGVRALPVVEPPAGFSEQLLGLVDHRRRQPAPGMSAGAAGAGAVRRRRVGVAALVASAAAAVAVLGLSSPSEAPARPPVGRLVEAHTGVGGGDPVSQLAPAGVPVSFRR
jgi:anti-sigma factor RsiW